MDVEDIYAEMQKSRDELGAKRKARRDLAVQELFQSHKEWLMTPERFIVVYTDEAELDLPGVVILKPALTVDMNRWKQSSIHASDAEEKIQGYKTLTLACAIYPERAIVSQMLDRHGSLAEALATPIIKASEAAAFNAKKG